MAFEEPSKKLPEKPDRELARPVIERGGLKYVWQTNAAKGNVTSNGSDVRYQDSHLDVDETYKNAVIGPDDGRYGENGVGIYVLEQS